MGEVKKNGGTYDNNSLARWDGMEYDDVFWSQMGTGSATR